MDWFFVIAVVLILAIAVAIALAPKAPRSEHLPYRKKASLFSEAERSFLGVLDQAVGADYRIFGQVRVADVVEVHGAKDGAARQSALNKINSKHFDFLLCDKASLAVVAAVELDDDSHSRKDRNRFLNELCAGIGLPLIREKAHQAYTVAKVKEDIAKKLGAAAIDPLPPMSAPETQTTSPAGGGLPPSTSQPVEPEAPSCPNCASPMVLRKGKKGTNKGEEIWGCPSYPKCRGTLLAPTDAQMDTRVAEKAGG